MKINKDKYSSLSVKNPFLEVGWSIDLLPFGVKETNGLLYAEKGRDVNGTSSEIKPLQILAQ